MGGCVESDGERGGAKCAAEVAVSGVQDVGGTQGMFMAEGEHAEGGGERTQKKRDREWAKG